LAKAEAGKKIRWAVMPAGVESRSRTILLLGGKCAGEIRNQVDQIWNAFWAYDAGYEPIGARAQRMTERRGSANSCYS
jgi:hypothetical protein